LRGDDKEQIAVSEAATAFDELDNLREERQARKLQSVLGQLVEAARHIA